MHWIIDGHNLIGQMPNLQLDDPHDEEKLLMHLRQFRARTGDKITVIFDPGGVYRPASTKKRGGITVQFVAMGKNADQIIKRRIKRIRNPQAFIVVSSDRAVQQAALAAKVRCVASGEFAMQLLPPSDPAVDAPADPGSQADVTLSPDEVDAWLDLFGKQG